MFRRVAAINWRAARTLRLGFRLEFHVRGKASPQGMQSASVPLRGPPHGGCGLTASPTSLCNAGRRRSSTGKVGAAFLAMGRSPEFRQEQKEKIRRADRSLSRLGRHRPHDAGD
jgi:hypothetical protein